MKKVLWLLVLSILFLVGCEEEQQMQYQEQPTQEKIYVQDDSGKWMEYAVLIALLNSQGRQFDEHHYHYGTSNGNGGYSSYTPRANEYTAMRNKTYKGTTIINKKVIVNKTTVINNNKTVNNNVKKTTFKKTTPSKSNNYKKQVKTYKKTSSYSKKRK